ncbi:hypothetical protein [uncultured Polaribacter sp.]|uniref:hypothetical protein n=1 Tax=uncultured Polaribacter sp. TaxID=174711 RepID=UPI002626E22B|nr:hypothetical protein [uncultured Polaribacter sp.]
MKNDYTDSKFKELLDKLQQESWQLELLISGFAIFGLVSSLDLLVNMLNEAKAVESYNEYLYGIALVACWVLIINLILHVVLRGLWIGAIGLRYVSGEIEYESLNYKKRFTNHLKKKVGSFDKYINTLENYCSILFAITFLYLFYIISFFLVILILVLISNFFMKLGLFSEMTGALLLVLFGMSFLFLALIVFIDFITQGYLKKKEWTSFLYFPIYKIFTIITLSFLYRPLVYNVLDDKFSKRLTFIITPIYILAFFFVTSNSIRSNYISAKEYSSVHYSDNNNYISTLEKNKYIKRAAIQSKVVKENYIHLFIPFKENIEDLIFDQNKDLEPEDDKRGFSNGIFSSKDKVNVQKKDSLNFLYLKAFKKIFTLKIDALKINTNFSFTEINNQIGFETFVSLKQYTEGKHIINLKRLTTSIRSKKIENKHVIDIPFWYFKQ